MRHPGYKTDLNLHIAKYMSLKKESLNQRHHDHHSCKVYSVLEQCRSQVRLRLSSASGKSLDRPPVPSDLSIGSYVCSSKARDVFSLTGLLQFHTIYMIWLLSAFKPYVPISIQAWLLQSTLTHPMCILKYWCT